ncbi:uncharacterized protein UTRI_02597 [Ustilago trichophora]|uniref:Uncharacterized protein n=1 Tax=Ustilago trichophora TaxID=86804 RepID=A0A5C3EPJ1_9BASI|nr:uncharacterized protein UTRI_02597 [Ustilago trichophora]
MSLQKKQFFFFFFFLLYFFLLWTVSTVSVWVSVRFRSEQAILLCQFAPSTQPTATSFPALATSGTLEACRKQAFRSAKTDRKVSTRVGQVGARRVTENNIGEMPLRENHTC